MKSKSDFKKQQNTEEKDFKEALFAEGQARDLRELLERNPELANKRFTDGFSPLTYAVARHDLAAIKVLVEYGARLSFLSDERFINSDKPVLGTEEDTLKDVRFLQGSTEFSYALENGYNDLVLVLLDAMNDDAGYAPGDKQRIAGEMLFAALKYHSQKREGASTWMIIQRLLNQGADINYNKGYQHDTPLYELLLHPEDEDTFSKSLLLKFLDCKGMENGELTVPVRVDNQCINALLQFHSSDKDFCESVISRASKDECTKAFYDAVAASQYDRIPLLVPHIDQNHCLWRAIAENNSKVLEHLLACSEININAKNDQGYTPLMLLLQGKPEANIVHTLLEDERLDFLQSRDSAPYAEWTALEFALNAGQKEFARIIWEKQKALGHFASSSSSRNTESKEDNEDEPLLPVDYEYDKSAILDLCTYLRKGAKRERTDRYYYGLFACFGGYDAGEKQDSALALLDVALGLRDLESLYRSEDPNLIGPLTQGELGKIFVRLIPEDLRNQTKARVESPQDSTYLKG